MVSNRMEIEGLNEASSSGSNPIAQQEEAVRGLIARLLPEHQDLFRVHGIGHCNHDHPAAPRFEVRVSGGLVHIQGTSGKVHSALCSWRAHALFVLTEVLMHHVYNASISLSESL